MFYIISKYKKLHNKDKIKIKYLLTGSLNTFFGLALYPIFYYILKSYQIHYLIILFFTQAICILFSFITTKLIVFKTKNDYFEEFLKFSTFYGIYFLVNLLFLPVIVEFLNINPVIAQTSFSCIVILSSYFWHSRISFYKKRF
jgi:putative flippase GtrA